jgi:hypothetical protein
MHRTAGRSAERGASFLRTAMSAPAPVIFMVASFLFPSELSLYLAGLRLPPHRVALLILLPLALCRLLDRRIVRLHTYDFLVLVFASLSLVAYWVNGEQTSGLVFGGSVALEAFVSYAVARAWVRNATDLKATLHLLVVAVLFAGLVALPETLLGGYFTHDFLRGLLGGEPMPPVEKRLGFYRAASVFDHPIHLGTFCASLLALVWTAERRLGVRTACLAITVLATLTAVSSAPILCLGLQIGLLIVERATRGLPARIALLLAITAGLYIGATLAASRSPFAIIATGFTIDSWTGFYRLMIWEYGLDTVAAHPFLGIGQADWERPKWMASATVDAFWLVIAMRTGVPSLLALLAAIVLLVTAVVRGRRRSRDPVVRRLAIGWSVSLLALSLAAATVHLWNVVFAYYFFFLGLGGWIADPLRAKSRAAAPVERHAGPRLRGWRRGTPLAPGPGSVTA